MIQIRATAVRPDGRNVEIVLMETSDIGEGGVLPDNVLGYFRQVFAVNSGKIVRVYKDNIGNLEQAVIEQHGKKTP